MSCPYTMWSYGVVLVHGEGDNSFTLATRFKEFKYQILWFGDSDIANTQKKKEELKALDIEVVDWADSMNLEQRIFQDLDWDLVQELIKIAIDSFGEESVIDQLNNVGVEQLSNAKSYTSLTDSPELRLALGKTAHKKGWYKDITKGELVGEIVAKYLANISTSDVYRKISMIRTWIDLDESSRSPS